MEKSCSNCKFFDAENIVCMHNARSYAILDEDKSAQDCDFYTEGTYNVAELEKTNYM